jgi:hypothetical protein
LIEAHVNSEPDRYRRMGYMREIYQNVFQRRWT